MEKMYLQLSLLNSQIIGFLDLIGPRKEITELASLLLAGVCSSIKDDISLLDRISGSCAVENLPASISLMLMATKYKGIEHRFDNIKKRLERTKINWGLVNLDEIDEIFEHLGEIQKLADTTFARSKVFQIENEKLLVEIDYKHNNVIDNYILNNKLDSGKSVSK